MTQTYRTTDMTRWGVGQGSDLTAAQVDINFWDIIQRLIELESAPNAAAGIDYFEVSGTQFYVHMTDHTILGPYALPVATFNDRGTWQPSTVYAVLDTFTINGGIYFVRFAHTSGTSFDPNANNGAGEDYYVLMIQTPGNALPTGGAVGQVIQKSTTTDFAVTWGWKTPTGGTARQYHIKTSSTQDASEWDTPNASDIEFTPTTSSALVSNDVSSAIEEVEDLIASSIDAIVVTADEVGFTPVTGSALTSNTVASALEELSVAVEATVGLQTIWIPASAMIPRTTNGAASGTVETTTNKNMIKTLDFDATTQEFAQADIVMPKSWDGGTLTFVPYWSHAAAVTNFGVVFGLSAVAVSNDDAFDVAFGTEQTSTDTGGTTNDLYVGPTSAAITVAGTPADADLVQFRISRNPANGSDTLAVDARLHGIALFYTTNAATDN